MKIIIANKDTFASKKSGEEYVKAQFINAVNGATGEIFLSKKEFEKFDVSIPDMATNIDLVSALKQVESVDVEFDQKGRLVSIR